MSTIHRAWLGPDPMPGIFKAYGEMWEALNPGWVLHDWDLEEVMDTQWINRPVIDHILNRVHGRMTPEAATQLADVLGYELAGQGADQSIYLNTDIQPWRSLAYMVSHYQLEPDQVYACKEDTTTSRIVNAVLGGPAGHPFWDTVIEALPKRYFEHPTAEMVETTGPALLTDCAHRWLRAMNPFQILPVAAFNSVHWSQIPLGGDATGLWVDHPDIVGIHVWHHRKSGRTNTVR